MLGCFKTPKNTFHMLKNKNEPTKPKISSTEDSYQEKTMIFVEKITKCHVRNLRHFEICLLTKIDDGILGRNLLKIEYLPNYRLEKVDFSNKNRLNKFPPPSWIIWKLDDLFYKLELQLKRIKVFLKSVKNWPFGSKSKGFKVLSAILNFGANFDFQDFPGLKCSLGQY
jgi:hypothetical protein